MIDLFCALFYGFYMLLEMLRGKTNPIFKSGAHSWRNMALTRVQDILRVRSTVAAAETRAVTLTSRKIKHHTGWETPLLDR